MDQQSPLYKIITVLYEQGYSEDQASDFVATLMKEGFAQIMEASMDVLTDEDITAIEKAQNQETANAEIAKRFEERTGKNAQVLMDEYYQAFADKFIEEYEKYKKEFTQKKEALQTDLSQKILEALEAKKITQEESQEIAEYILTLVDIVTNEEQAVKFLDELAKQWPLFADIANMEKLKFQDEQSTEQKIEDVKEDINDFAKKMMFHKK